MYVAHINSTAGFSTYNDQSSINVQAVKQSRWIKWARKACRKTRNSFIQMWTSDVTTSVSCYFEEARVWSAPSPLLLLCSHVLALTAAPRAPVVDTLKPERRWCHGPDVKQARWRFHYSLPAQLQPEQTAHTHRPRDWAATVWRWCLGKTNTRLLYFLYCSRVGFILWMQFTNFQTPTYMYEM